VTYAVPCATGKREYLERRLRPRHVLALRISPPPTAENYAHASQDKLAGVTGLHWGTGSSVVSIHLITALYGDAYVDVKGGWGTGIDGCRVTDVHTAGDTIRIGLVDAVSAHRSVKLVFGNVQKLPLHVVVNGRPLGRHDVASLKRGIYVTLARRVVRLLHRGVPPGDTVHVGPQFSPACMGEE
jgi:hypothetical protein